MKKIMIVLISIFITLNLTGCMDILIKAPKGKEFILSSITPRNNEYDAQKMVLYALWGLVPITDNSTEDLLALVPDGSIVAINTKMTFLDYVITSITGYFLSSRTIEISVIQ